MGAKKILLVFRLRYFDRTGDCLERKYVFFSPRRRLFFFFSKCCGDPSFTSRSSDSFPNAHTHAHSPMQTHVHTHILVPTYTFLCITLISPLTHTHTCNHQRTRSRLSFSLPLNIFLPFVLASDKTLLSVLGHPFIYSDIAIF